MINYLEDLATLTTMLRDLYEQDFIETPLKEIIQQPILNRIKYLVKLIEEEE